MIVVGNAKSVTKDQCANTVKRMELLRLHSREFGEDCHYKLQAWQSNLRRALSPLPLEPS